MKEIKRLSDVETLTVGELKDGAFLNAAELAEYKQMKEHMELLKKTIELQYEAEHLSLTHMEDENRNALPAYENEYERKLERVCTLISMGIMLDDIEQTKRSYEIWSR